MPTSRAPPPQGERFLATPGWSGLEPLPGRGWFPRHKPRRLRATYHRTRGVRHLLGVLDLATGKIHYRIRDRKRRQEFLGLLKSLRVRWPDDKLYVIANTFSADVRDWAATHDVELVLTTPDAPGGGEAECGGLVANGDELVAQEARVSFGNAVVELAHEIPRVGGAVRRASHASDTRSTI